MAKAPASNEPSTYMERLWPPSWLWLVAAMWPLTLAVAYGYALGAPVGWVVGATLSFLVVAGLVHVSSTVRVTADGVQVGAAFLEVEYCGNAMALDAQQTREAAGPSADARAFVATRGWIHQSVRLDVNDNRDPTPYWLVYTRRPNELAAAINGVAPDNAELTCEDPSQRSKEA